MVALADDVIGPMPRLDRLEAVVFDFDGVILESAALKGDAFLELFSDHPGHLPAIRDHHLENLGVSRFEKFDWIYRNLLKRSLSDEERLRLGARYSALVFERTAASPFVPGALEVLEALEGRFPLFVASATPQEELESVVERRDLTHFFTSVHGSPPAKGELLIRIVRLGGFDPNHVLMIGDGISDLRAAERAGCRFLARIDDQAPAQPFPEDTWRIPHLGELMDLLC